MDPLVILLLGMTVVIGSILGLRLPAFLALLLGAFLVGLLTPIDARVQFAIDNESSDLAKKKKERIQALVQDREEKKGDKLNEQELQEVEALAEKMHVADEEEIRQSVKKQTIGDRLATGFGNTALKIGILIAMASIIDICLLESGSADRIVRWLLRLFGESRAAFAFLVSGFLLGIPVFFDTVFYLMIPLGKAMRLRTGKNYVLYVMSITAGGTMAHSLVPPTPGPLFVAEELQINLGVMIMAGCAVGLFTSLSGFAFAHWANKRMEVPLRDVPDSLVESVDQDESKLPPTWLALLPILLPVIFISGSTIIKSVVSASEYKSMELVQTLGNKNVALMIAAAIAVGTLVWRKRTSREELSKSLQSALSSAGMIILITSAGGAFGAVLQQTNVSQRIEDMNLSAGTQLIWIPVAFFITTLIRTAQGSATVAMFVAVGIIAGPASTITAFHPVYLALAIGCGSKPIAWMNDSGFWVICKMSGMTEKETLKTITPMSIIMGLTGLGIVMLAAAFLPLK